MLGKLIKQGGCYSAAVKLITSAVWYILGQALLVGRPEMVVTLFVSAPVTGGIIAVELSNFDTKCCYLFT